MKTSLWAVAALASMAGPACAQSYAVLHAFGGAPRDGAYPNAGFTVLNGALYSTTVAGGTQDNGTAFSYVPATHTKNTLYSFLGGTADAAHPSAGLTQLNGMLYGVANGGGAAGTGALFAIAPGTYSSPTEQLLHSFGSGTDGAYPFATLLSLHGTLYGTTFLGGTAGKGSVFSYSQAAGEQVIYSLSGTTDGAETFGGLIAQGNTLYGAAYAGGTGTGTVYALNRQTGAERTLYTFQGGTDAANPFATLTRIGTTLYGTAIKGGATGQGAVFAVDTRTGTETVLHNFAGGADGAQPNGTLLSYGGKLYGTTHYGGGAAACSSGCGTVFSLDPATGNVSILHAFAGGTDGAFPLASLIVFRGAFYSTTQGGGGSTVCSVGCGTVFRLGIE